MTTVETGDFWRPTLVTGATGLVGSAPRSNPDWDWNNLQTAAQEFLRTRNDFEEARPQFRFNERMVEESVTYWPGGWLKKRVVGA